MKTTIKFILLITLTSLAFSQCTIPNPGQITVDQGSAVVCLHLMLNGTYNTTYAFPVSVDYFEALVINGMANYINTQVAAGVTEVSFQVQFQNSDNSTVQQIEIYNLTGQRYRDILSFIIIADQGSFTSISLDNQACDNLGSGTVCYNSQAYTQTPTNGTYGGADPRFFVSWMGSDVNGNHFISQTRRLSRFASFSVGSIYNDAKNVITA